MQVGNRLSTKRLFPSAAVPLFPEDGATNMPSSSSLRVRFEALPSPGNGTIEIEERSEAGELLLEGVGMPAVAQATAGGSEEIEVQWSSPQVSAQPQEQMEGGNTLLKGLC